MRVQPHVWASADLDGGYILDVIADSVCTHGHPRAIVGACFHAATLAHCLRDGAVPGPSRWEEIAAGLTDAPSLIENHRSLGSTWTALWEQETGKRLRDAWQDTVGELRTAIGQAADGANGADSTSEAYQGISTRLGLTDKAQRGSGILTPVAAVALAAVAAGAHDAAVVAANEIGTDTDTIATMAGALLGACDAATEPPEKPLDADYLIREADRLVSISQGGPTAGHSYPDILTWTAPQTQADAMVQVDDQLVVDGLGAVTELGADVAWTSSKHFAWQWVSTEFGQTLLIKRRPEVRSLQAGIDTEPSPAPITRPLPGQRVDSEGRASNQPAALPRDRGVDVGAALNYAKEWIADDARLGYTVRRVARDGTPEDLAALIAALRDDLRR